MSPNEQIARPIPLDQIRPDPAQPRQLLPPDLLAVLGAGGSPFDILVQLRTRSEHDKWIRERVVELDALAHSIDEDSLMNPIRLIADGNERYRIEEGERRWWAHHILVQQGKEKFQTIPAFMVESSSLSSGLLRRRVAENVLRSEFTAIELGRAMASRIQEILEAEPGIKRVEAESRVGKENGMSDRRVRQFVGLLKLAPETQELAQQARLTENALRQIVGIKDIAQQLAAAHELMHSSPKKTRTISSAESNALRKPGQGKKSRSNRKAKSGKITKESHRHGLVPSKSNKTKLRNKNPQSASQTIQKVLVLTQNLDIKDWRRAMRQETDRRAILHLHQTLARASGVLNQTSNELASSNDRGHSDE